MALSRWLDAAARNIFLHAGHSLLNLIEKNQIQYFIHLKTFRTMQKTYYLGASVLILFALCCTSTGEKPKYKCETCDAIVENFRKVGLIQTIENVS